MPRENVSVGRGSFGTNQIIQSQNRDQGMINPSIPCTKAHACSWNTASKHQIMALPVGIRSSLNCVDTDSDPSSITRGSSERVVKVDED